MSPRLGIFSMIFASFILAGGSQAMSSSNSRSEIDSAYPAKATFGGGCFWCIEAVFAQLEGVGQVVSGYAGGQKESPSYSEVCGGGTGHAEVVQVSYDPERISYEELLTVFFSVHDPTTLNRQGADRGTQYRSIILTSDEAQKKAAESLIAALDAEAIWKDPIVTEVKPLHEFYPAEKYHQEYYERNSEQPYCVMVIEPKLEKFREKFAGKLKR